MADSCASLRRQLSDAQADGRFRGSATSSVPPEATTLPEIAVSPQEIRLRLESLGAQWVRGAEVEWPAFYRGRSLRRAILPAYPFERERHWLEPEAVSPRGPEPITAPALFPGRRLSSPLSDIQYEISLGAPAWPLLADHRIYGAIVVPGAWHLAMILAGAREVFGTGSILLRGILFPRALTLDETEVRSAQVVFRPGEQETTFQVWSLPAPDAGPASPWLLHAQGAVVVGLEAETSSETLLPAEVEARCPETIPLTAFYQRMRDRQIHLGPGFRWNARVSSNEAETLSRVFPPTSETGDFLLHPGLLDSCIQLVLARLPPTYLPLSIDQLRFDPPFGQPGVDSRALSARATVAEADSEVRIADVRIVDEKGRALLEMEGLAVKRATPSALLGDVETRGVDIWFYELQWEPSPPPESQSALDGNGNWLVFLDSGGVGAALAGLLEKHGQRCVRVVPDDESGPGAAGWWLDPREAGRFPTSCSAKPSARKRRMRAGVASFTSGDWTHRRREKDRSDACCEPVLSLIHELTALESGAPRLWLVTRGVQSISSEPGLAAVAQGPLWGLGRVIATEHPGLHCTLVDLDPAHAEDAAPALFEEILSLDGEDQLAYRHRRRYVARLVRLTAPTPETAPSRLRIPTRGVLSDLQLQPAERRAPAERVKSTFASMQLG